MLDKSTLSAKIPSTLSPQEVAKFDALAEQWWDPNGKFKAALSFNKARMHIMLRELCAFFGRDQTDSNCLNGLNILEVGSGGGLICEALAQCGANVMGIDASGQSVEVARRHADKSGLTITYEHCLASTLVAQQREFDVVINAEVVEHVPDQETLIQECRQLVKDGGALLLATLNRTIKSYLVAILGAEYLLRLLPIGTHDWRMFVRPEQLAQWLEANDRLVFSAGMQMNPLIGKWKESKSLAVNYLQLYQITRD